VAAQLAAELEAMTEPKKDKKGRKRPPKPVHSVKVRNQILRLLSFVSGVREIPAVGRALKDLKTRQMALYLLERNGSSEAANLLIEALDQVGPNFRVGVVNALAKRRGTDVLEALQKVASSDKEPQVRMAAIEALSQFAEPANDTVIAQAATDDCKYIKDCAHKARVRLAEKLRNADKKDDAAKVYQAILSSDARKAQKKAAQIGLETLG
jgi:HEAT repeat protein